MKAQVKRPLETTQDLLDMLHFGKQTAMHASSLYEELPIEQRAAMDMATFKRRLRTLSAMARDNGHRVIGDDSGYYIAVNAEEWDKYKKMRFSAMRDEIEGFAKCERLSVRDLIKEVYCVKVDNPNYEMNL